MIINGHAIDLPKEVSTVADRLGAGGWKTAAFGKWVSCSLSLPPTQLLHRTCDAPCHVHAGCGHDDVGLHSNLSWF